MELCLLRGVETCIDGVVAGSGSDAGGNEAETLESFALLERVFYFLAVPGPLHEERFLLFSFLLEGIKE